MDKLLEVPNPSSPHLPRLVLLSHVHPEHVYLADQSKRVHQVSLSRIESGLCASAPSLSLDCTFALEPNYAGVKIGILQHEMVVPNIFPTPPKWKGWPKMQVLDDPILPTGVTQLDLGMDSVSEQGSAPTRRYDGINHELGPRVDSTSMTRADNDCNNLKTISPASKHGPEGRLRSLSDATISNEQDVAHPEARQF